MFEKFDTSSCILIYKGLKTLIEIGDGSGFHNHDMGHPVYILGASGKHFDEMKDADRPKNNDLFFMLAELSRRLKKEGFSDHTWWYDFSDWQFFCKFTIQKYKELKKT